MRAHGEFFVLLYVARARRDRTNENELEKNPGPAKGHFCGKSKINETS